MQSQIAVDPSALPAYWHENFSGVWAMELGACRSLLATAERLDMTLHIEQNPKEAAELAAGPEYVVDSDGIAVLNLRGPMTKYASSFGDGVGTAGLRRTIGQMRRDESVRAVLMMVDSPGGSTAGQTDLAAALESLAAEKPTAAYIEDMGASAAYWAAAMLDNVYANESALVGSIGVYGVLVDSSEAAAAEGLKFHLLTTGPYKGMGAPGVAITEPQLEYVQARVHRINEFFLAAIERGRGMSREAVEELADGRVHIGADAVDRGLVDAILSIEEARAALAASISQPEGAATMPATIEELKAACPGASAEFILGLAELGAEVSDAKDAWIEEQGRQLEAASAQAAQASAVASQGVAPIGAPDAGAAADDDSDAPMVGDAEAELNRLIDARMASHNEPRHKAALYVMSHNEHLRSAAVEDHNRLHPTHSNSARD